MATTTLAIADADTQVLLDSGRWLETLLPLGNGDKHMLVGAFYGVSGASLDAAKTRENEQLLTLAVKHLMQFQHTPYVLAGDFNVDPLESEVLSLAIDWLMSLQLVPPTLMLCTPRVRREECIRAWQAQGRQG